MLIRQFHMSDRARLLCSLCVHRPRGKFSPHLEPVFFSSSASAAELFFVDKWRGKIKQQKHWVVFPATVTFCMQTILISLSLSTINNKSRRSECVWRLHRGKTSELRRTSPNCSHLVVKKKKKYMRNIREKSTFFCITRLQLQLLFVVVFLRLFCSLFHIRPRLWVIRRAESSNWAILTDAWSSRVAMSGEYRNEEARKTQPTRKLKFLVEFRATHTHSAADTVKNKVCGIFIYINFKSWASWGESSPSIVVNFIQFHDDDVMKWKVNSHSTQKLRHVAAAAVIHRSSAPTMNRQRPIVHVDVALELAVSWSVSLERLLLAADSMRWSAIA